jgi:hypothetical protein
MREDSSVRENIYSLDLSHDTRTLVYQYWYAWPDPDNADVSLALNAVRMLNIESCDDPDTEPCGFGDLDQAFELDSDIGTTSDLIGFYYPVWGPLGERIYVRKGFDDPEIGAYKTLRYYDLEGNWQDLEWPPVVVKTDTVIADLGWFIRVSSGIVDGVEYLAYEREFSVETGGCEGIFIVNAEDCLVNENCSTEPEFAGAYATWSKDGRLIHAYDGWEPHGECGLGSVGYWDGSDNSLESLFDGYRPDAAGGIR